MQTLRGLAIWIIVFLIWKCFDWGLSHWAWSEVHFKQKSVVRDTLPPHPSSMRNWWQLMALGDAWRGWRGWLGWRVMMPSGDTQRAQRGPDTCRRRRQVGRACAASSTMMLMMMMKMTMVARWLWGMRLQVWVPVVSHQPARPLEPRLAWLRLRQEH